MTYFKAANLKDIGKETVIEVDLDGYSLLLYRDEEDRIYCIKNCCSHDNFKLLGGEVKKSTITCPQHGAKFDLKTGEALTMPAVAEVESFPVKTKGNEIFIGIEE